MNATKICQKYAFNQGREKFAKICQSKLSNQAKIWHVCGNDLTMICTKKLKILKFSILHKIA